MTYLDSAENITITHERAIIELEMHGISGIDVEEFYGDMGGKKSTYDAQDVLHWLGY
tara:strand:+ start:156 stop:326 length:171 start_codon:yes stop_codon:yes gene_type:complete